jgi:hypothetical protein
MAEAAWAPPLEPETLWQFRVGQLLLLLTVTADVVGRGVDIDRLAYYDFFAANPFLIYERRAPERLQFSLAGFDSQILSYASSAQRFANRRRRLEGDLARLTSLGLASPSTSARRVEWALEEAGREMASGFTAMYASAYLASARVVVRRLHSLSDRRLRERSAEWLKARDFLLDLSER